MKIIYFLLFILVTSIHSLQSQTAEFNAVGDLEVSTAGNNSHYYYNGIDKDHTDLRLGISQLNILGQVTLDSQWSVHTRLVLERDKGQKLERLKVPQLNIEWLSKNRRFAFMLGNFINPFGSFNKKQLSTERNFIGLPLAYAYYQNISDKIGYNFKLTIK